MTDPNLYITIASAGLAGLGIVTAASLSGWRGWLQLKREQLEADRQERTPAGPVASAGNRIEMADLRERIRKLEAIAAGVDL
ncbi:hypothetical protein SAMN06297144_2779 [Sphingomonas guangdongensis]|uniref:Phage shock protein B n=1 Tax=Sphingomonas guangdongensis TaxID=1141890 RepID=A0A285R0J5_9SPHN|nr:hypothetical protein [Sphingomonas guangdongensis]SOB87643.1 hypothetical protein SAMN06297144_2779 [Sphingomonas guangdongensis]